MDRLSNYTSIEQVAGQYLNPKVSTAKNTDNGVSFEEMLNKQRSITEMLGGQKADAGRLKFSKHAGIRLAERNINLTVEQMERLENGVSKAGSKGIKESLVILDNYAFIVNINNNTVITAMDPDHEEENIYTNIDGAVII